MKQIFFCTEKQNDPCTTIEKKSKSVFECDAIFTKQCYVLKIFSRNDWLIPSYFFLFCYFFASSTKPSILTNSL